MKRGEKRGAGKIVVMLSSVAKPPPAVTQPLSVVAPRADAPPKIVPGDSSKIAQPQSPLPPKQVAPASGPLSPPRVSTTTFVKLPPKTSLPQLSGLVGKPLVVPGSQPTPVAKATPPPLPPKWSEPARTEPKKSGAQHIPPIKLNELSSSGDVARESIFAKEPEPTPAPQAAPKAEPKPEGWKSLEPGELPQPAGGLQSLEVFARSQRILDKPAPTPAAPTPVMPAPAPTPTATGKPSVAPPLLPPTRMETPFIVAKPGPLTTMPLPSSPAKAPEPTATSSLHVAPPMLEKAPEPHSEKLAQPNLPYEARKSEAPVESPAVAKAPPLIQPDAPSAGQPPPVLPAKPLLPPASPVAKVTSWMKKSAPLVVSSTSAKIEPPKIAEAKPSLKPAVLPRRSLLVPVQEEVATPPPPVETPQPASEPLKPAEAAKPATTDTTKAPETPVIAPAPALASSTPVAKPAADTPPPVGVAAAPVPSVSVPPKAPLPPTRAARAKNRRMAGVIFFWAVLIPLAGVAMAWGAFHFGPETRVEGQAIPPPGMVLSNEVWVVNDFRDLASGIAEDLAAERTPLMLEIQERQDHVQRAQADVASREERIRLIQQDMQAAKDEITAIIKQSRDATQQIWDGEGAQIDAEYNSRLAELQKTISDRAKSLNLKYEPDPAFESPEVWANAYRLALYEVPAGVDSVKEHEWLGDEMKQWRDFLKTLDDRKEQLREKAAQLKLAPAPKIADLNAKIDDLQQRVDGTTAEEVPLKAELAQAQTDLAQAQAAEAGLDDKYYKQLDGLPGEAILNNIRIPLATNGRFSWTENDPFAEGEKEHSYWIFARATRSDGRQYWALGRFSIEKNHKICLLVVPDSFVSTKAILRPNLSPEEQEQ